MNIRLITIGVGANIYDKLIIAGAQIAMVPALATSWGVEVYGAWLLLATIPSFLAMSDLGFATAAGVRMTMAVARDDKVEAVGVFHSAWVMVLASTAAIGVLALVLTAVLPSSFWPKAEGFAPQEMQTTLVFLIGYGLLSLQASIFLAGFRSAGCYARGAFWSANTVLVETLAVITVALSGGKPADVAAALLFSRLLGLGLQFLVLRSAVPWLSFDMSCASAKVTKELVAPAVAVMALPLGQASFLQGAVIALGAAAGETAVPAFAAARTLSRIGLQVTQLVVHALMPEFSAAVARADRRAQAHMLIATLGSAAIVLLPFALLLAFAGSWMVDKWSGGVIYAAPGLMLIMAVTVVLGGFWNPLSNLVLAMNRQSSFSYSFAVLAILTIPLGYYLAVPLGATGVAIAVATMDAVMCLLIIRLGRRLFVSRAELAAAVRTIGKAAIRLLRQKAR